MEIIIANQEKFERKVKTLQEGGASNLHLVSDFDKTLTVAHDHLGKIVSSYSRLRNCKLVPKEYFEESSKLKEKYYPLEMDSKISKIKKAKLMQEWWEAAWNNKIKFALTTDILKAVSLDQSLKLRDGVSSFFRILWEKDVPILIFSSGIGNVIDLKLKQAGLLTKNIHLIANFLSFDDSGIAVDHNRPLVTVFNKNEVSIKGSSFHKEIENRKNVILLGDSLGDVGMADGINHDCVLKIGFFNRDNGDRVDFLKEYDVLILGDPNFSYVNELLSKII